MKKILLLTVSFCLAQSLMAQDGPFTFNGKTRIFTGNGIHWNADQDASTNLVWRTWSNRYFDFNGSVFRQDGKVGIGTVSPSYKLHTVGDIYASQSFKVGETNQITSDALFNGYRSSTNTGTVYGLKVLRYLSQSTVNTGGIFGLHVISGPSFTSTAQNVYGIYTKAQTFSAGTATNAYSLYSDSPTGSITNAYNIYASGGADNYFGGNVGIGTASPGTKLEVFESTGGISNFITVGASSYESMRVGVDDAGARIQSVSATRPIYFITNGAERMRVTSNGDVGIGTTNPGEKLEVNGNALIDGELYSKKVKVSLSPGNWPDYVFAKSYQLTPLDELEEFIKSNHHLPEVPSAKEVEKEGLDLGDMDATLLKKVEELTLYVLELEAGRKKLETQNSVLKRSNRVLDDTLKEVIRRLENLEKK